MFPFSGKRRRVIGHSRLPSDAASLGTPAYQVTPRHIPEEQKHQRKAKNSTPTFGVTELSNVGGGKALDW
jgi:hypothetical protein